jgi:hypothetical protein
MDNGSSLEGLIRSTKQYEFKDGLREIQIGLYLLALTGLIWLGFQPEWLRFILRIKQTGGIDTSWLAVLLFLFSPIALLALIHLLIRYLRRRFLWAETGEVQPVRRVVSFADSLAAVLILFTAVAVGILLAGRDDQQVEVVWRWIWLGAGLGTAWPLYALGRRYDLARLKWEAIIGSVYSALLIRLPFSTFPGPALGFGIGWGLLLCIGGGLALQQAWRQKDAGSHA